MASCPPGRAGRRGGAGSLPSPALVLPSGRTASRQLVHAPETKERRWRWGAGRGPVLQAPASCWPEESVSRPLAAAILRPTARQALPKLAHAPPPPRPCDPHGSLCPGSPLPPGTCWGPGVRPEPTRLWPGSRSDLFKVLLVALSLRRAGEASPHGTQRREGVWGPSHLQTRRNTPFRPTPSPAPAAPAQGLRRARPAAQVWSADTHLGRRPSRAGCVLWSAADCGAGTGGRL